MYSILPAIVSLLFLVYGLYVLYSRGRGRISLSFFLLCMTTFCWQFTWAVLFQVDAVLLAQRLSLLGYLLILFLPTTLYHFISELTASRAELPRVAASYLLASGLAILLVSTNWIIDGLYHYFFGYYPKAGWLHPLHLLQTALVVSRALYLLYRRRQVALSTEKTRLGYCLVSMLIYFIAAVDYLCNYGLEFYPPGVLCIAISLGLVAQAMVRHNLLADPLEVAASIAHEMRTPLGTLRNQSRLLARCMPELLAGYQQAQGARAVPLNAQQLSYLATLGTQMETEIRRSNFIVEMMLTSARAGPLASEEFDNHSIKKCVDEALACFPFEPAMRARVTVRDGDDFTFFGSDMLLVYVLYNLFKNALCAIQQAGRGDVEISFTGRQRPRQLLVTDTGSGIPDDVLPHVFEPFYSTRHSGGGTGMGLAFCQRVLTSFGGSIRCESRAGEYTRFALLFPD
ncbi:MAG: ATP-binding protein [Sphingomonadaceae bacterium]